MSSTRCHIHGCNRRAQVKPQIRLATTSGEISQFFDCEIQVCAGCMPTLTLEVLLGQDKIKVDNLFVDKHLVMPDWKTASVVWSTLPKKPKLRLVKG